MGIAAIITLIIIVAAIILFMTEAVSIDLVAILVMVAFVFSGVLSPDEAISGFSNKATITVAFMFVLSAALLKTGALQFVAYRLAQTFRENFTKGMVLMMALIAVISAFVNNTPVVAVFIPVIIQIAHLTGHSSSKMLIPLSFASIFGGMCTLIGTSTNILVSGIAEGEGLEPLGMFEMAPIGIILLLVGIVYMIVIGFRLLPNRKNGKSLEEKFKLRDYITDIELLPESDSVGKRIMDSPMIRELDMDILEVRRNGSVFNLPQGDFILKKKDVLKVRCDIEKIKALKDRSKIDLSTSVKIGEDDLRGRNSSLVELVISSDSEYIGKTLKEVDFRRRYRATPLAIKSRKEIQNDDIYNSVLRAGDVILADFKTHYLKELKKRAEEQSFPFFILSEDQMLDFRKKRFALVLTIVAAIILLATFGVVDIMIGAIAGVSILVLLNSLTMKEVYRAINWKIIFLLAGALSMGVAMKKSGLDTLIAENLIMKLGDFGPYILIGGLYFITSFLTEVMSNNATAALIAPIAIATASALGIPATPLLVTIMIAASASFMTPVGYQTNTMVFSAGQYKYLDFIKVGVLLNILFGILVMFLVPLFYNM